jgi:hypothetical protein
MKIAELMACLNRRHKAALFATLVCVALLLVLSHTGIRLIVGIALLGMALSWALGSNSRPVHWLFVVVGLVLLVDPVWDGFTWPQRRPEIIESQKSLIQSDLDLLKASTDVEMHETDPQERRKDREDSEKARKGLDSDERELGQLERDGRFDHVIRNEGDEAAGGVLALSAGLGLLLWVGDAAKLVVTLVQEHEERKAAPAMDATLSALKTLFSQEQPAYDSLNKVSVTLAGSLARYCIDQNLVSDASVLSPALQPFNLTASLPSGGNSASLNAVAKTRVDEQTAQLVAKQNAASVAMLQALTEMNTRLHQLATEGHMTSRATPVTLTTVENWVATAGNYVSTTSASPAAASTASKTPSKSSK